MINLDDLTPEERDQLLEELATKQKAEKDALIEAKRELKDNTDTFVTSRLPGLLDHRSTQLELLNSIIEEAQGLIDKKHKVYDIKEDQDSHTFTARDGSGSFKIGYNVTIGFDGTESAGIAKVKAFINGLGKNPDKRQVLKKINDILLRKNKADKLDPTRIVELQEITNELNEPELTEGVEIIVNAQFRTRTSQYVRGWALEKGEEGIAIKRHFSFKISDLVKS